MMKLNKIIPSTILSLALTLPATRANATGIPVVDLLNFGEATADYVESVYNSVAADLNIAENVKTAVTVLNAYNQAVEKYKDYKDMYRNITSILSNADIKTILPSTMLGVDISPLMEGGLNLKSFDTNSNYINAGKEIDAIYQRTDNDWATNKAKLLRLLAGVKDQATVDAILAEQKRIYTQAQLATAQKYAVDVNEQNIADSITAFATLEGKRAQVAAAPKNQLQVLKLIATQNQAILQNLIKNNQIANQRFNYANQSFSDRKARAAKTMEDRIATIQKEKNRISSQQWKSGPLVNW